MEFETGIHSLIFFVSFEDKVMKEVNEQTQMNVVIVSHKGRKELEETQLLQADGTVLIEDSINLKCSGGLVWWFLG